MVRGGGHGHGVLLEGGEVGRSYIRRFSCSETEMTEHL